MPVPVPAAESASETRTPATIFATGLWAIEYADELREIVADPLLEVENHSMTHAAFDVPCYTLDVLTFPDDKRHQVVDSAQILAEATGRAPQFFRFPGGCYAPDDVGLVQEAGELPVGWDVVSGDPFQQDPAVVVHNVPDNVRPGSIVVLHLNGAPNAPATAALHTRSSPACRPVACNRSPSSSSWRPTDRRKRTRQAMPLHDNRDQIHDDQVTADSAQSHMTQGAIDRFHQILREKDIAQATHRFLISEQRALGLEIEGRPLTQLLRPRLISSADHARVCAAGALLAGALQRLAGYVLQDSDLGDHVRQVLAVTPVEKALVAMCPPADDQNPQSRLDGFLAADRLAFVEYNAPSVGALTQEALADIFAGTPAMRTFTGDYRVQATPTRRHIVQHVTHAWTTGGMPGDGPRVAIVECGQSKCSWEFDILQAELHRHGVPAVITSTEDLCYEPRQGGLYTRDTHGHRYLITVVYRRATLKDMLSRYGPALTDHPLVRAWSAGTCVMINSFTGYPAAKKSAFALLTDPHTSVVLSPQEASAAQQYLPWTRLVRPGPTTYHGHEIDLLTFARGCRENLVLKPNVGYGGQGILCGWQTTDHDWRRALDRAMHDPHVVQERVTIPKAHYPAWTDGSVSIRTYRESTDPFLFNSTAYGFACRLSQNELINVTSGGAVAPVFQIEPRV